MWPVLVTFLRSYAPIITLPFAAVIGIIGYNLENILSDKYTPYNGQCKNNNVWRVNLTYISIADSVKERRDDRLMSDEVLRKATDVESLRYSANVLGRNLSPSLSKD